MKTNACDGWQEPRGDDSPEESDFSQFIIPWSEASDSIPADQMPRRHSLPSLEDDPSIIFPQWNTIFCNDLNLTNGREGLLGQKVNQDITEIAEAIQHRFEFVAISGQLAVYEDPCWKIMGQDEIIRFVKKNVHDLFPEEGKCLNVRQWGEIANHLLHDERIALFQEIPAPDSRYLCCRDCLYDWRSGKCIPHNSSFWRFSFLDLNAEEIGNCDGPYWEQFLDNLTGGDNQLRQRILEMIGVILSGYPSKAFFFMQGESGTGKSQLVNFLKDVLGTGACMALNDISQLGQKWTTGSLFGKLLCLCGDMPDAPLDSRTIGTIKQLTGDDLIRGELKYKNAFNFENTAKLLFVSNYPLQIPNQYQEAAFLNRLVVIPCRNPVPQNQQIPALHNLLHQEAGYIVGLALDALCALEDGNGAFTPLSDDANAASVRMSEEEELICDFVQDCCVLSEDASCAVGEVFQAFRTYAPEVQLAPANFSKLIYRLFPQVESSRSNSARMFRGLCLRNPALN